VKDGISLVKTGEGALQEVQDMLNRMVTLATQSANGTYDETTDRANLQKEVDALKDEIDRIADSANFNGINLLNGEQAGATVSVSAWGAGSTTTNKATVLFDLGVAKSAVIGNDLIGGKLTINGKTYTIELNSQAASAAISGTVFKVGKKATAKTVADAIVGTAATLSGVKSVAGGAMPKLEGTAKTLDDGHYGITYLASSAGVELDVRSIPEIKLSAGLELQIGDTADDYNQMNVSISDMHVSSLYIDKIDISTQEGADDAINKIKTAINMVSSTRGDLGAIQNRLEHTQNNLSVMAENIQDAESTIRDTDVADEMMAYTKNNILVQSAQAMLAQANTVPQGVLQLLQ
jgi:flagellin